MKKKRSHRYWLSITVLMVIALALGGYSLGTALQWKPLAGIANILDFKPHEVPFLLLGTSIVSLLAIFVYLIGLNPYNRSRPLLLVFLNLLAPGLYVALAFLTYDRSYYETFTEISRYGAPAAALTPPILFLLGEILLYRILRTLGRAAQDKGYRPAAIRMLMIALAFRPADKDTRRRCGLLYVEEEECRKGLALLENLNPLEGATDDEILKAMEHCYRANGRIREALRVLLRMSQLHPDLAWIDRKILDDFVRLEMPREALDMLESGKLKLNLELLQLAEKLNLGLGNYAQAMAQIRQIASEEGTPHNLATRLYRDMLELLPDHLEVRINLAFLLMESEVEERRREGAALIEEVLKTEPHRVHLARRLIQFYTESNQPQAARKYLKALVLAGDPDPEYHLVYAQALTDEEQYEEAAGVLQNIVKRWPEDWRGHMRFSRVLLQLDHLEDAENEFALAARTAPEEAKPLLDTIRGALEQRRREIFVRSMVKEVARHGDDIDKRFELVDHQIAMEWVDEALRECDRLLEENPALIDEVVEHIEKGIEHAPRSYSLRSYLSDIYFQQGRYDDALHMYREMAEQSLHPSQVITDGCRMILDRAPDHLEARRELALACRANEDWSGVVEALDPLIHENAPLPPEDKILWVEAAYRLWRLDGAVRVGMTLVDELATEPGFMIMMVDILMDANEFEKALNVYKKARAASPEDQRLARMETKVVNSRTRSRLNLLQRHLNTAGDLTPEEHFEKAELHRALGQAEESIVHYQRAAYDAELSPLATAKLGETLCERGMYDLADETLAPFELTRELAASHPEIKDLLYKVGRALEKIRQFDKAVRYYKKIFRVDASYEDIVTRIDRLT